MEEGDRKTEGTISLWIALSPVLVLIALLAADVVFFADDSSYGSNQVALLIAALIAGGIGMARGVKWEVISKTISDNIGQATEALLILLLIGSLSGAWLMAGIIPAFIHYGLLLLEPNIFLFAACVVCAILSLATGSSWGTVGTVGIALVGIGSAMGISEGWVAGAIISGAYFGDKLSPLSDTTNLAPAVAGTDLITHIKYMTITTIPSIVISLIVFLVVGFTSDVSSPENVQFASGFSESVNSIFNIHLGLFVAPVAVLVMIAKKVPATAALFIGVLLGVATAIICQPQAVMSLAGEGHGFAASAYIAAMMSMAVDTAYVTGNELADSLLQAGGMKGMMNTIWLIICAMTFGATLQAAGLLSRITESLISGVNSVFGLISRTVGTCIAFNVLASDQYIAIVVPGKMFEEAYKEQNLAPENLSRTLEDAGTVTSVLIPWNTCGVAQSGILGVATLAYAPYCIFNWISPIMSLIIAGVGYKLKRLD
jgi:NhaC family Na+:H+ antiporter